MLETVVICTKERIDRDNSDLEEMQEFKEALASYKSTTNIQISQCNSEVLESELPNHCNTFLKTFYYWHYLTSDRYSQSRIEEIARDTGIPAQKIKEDLYGKELFEGELATKSLTKYKRDIAKSIGVEGID
jgi:hypothetical protein